MYQYNMCVNHSSNFLVLHRLCKPVVAFKLTSASHSCYGNGTTLGLASHFVGLEVGVILVSTSDGLRCAESSQGPMLLQMNALYSSSGALLEVFSKNRF